MNKKGEQTRQQAKLPLECRKMTKFSLPPLRLLILGLLGSIIIMVGAYAGIRALWQPKDLDAFLPAEETVVYFHHVHTEDRRHWSDLFPALRSIPVLGPSMDIGILRSNQSPNEGWAASPVPYVANFAEANGRIGRQVLLVSPEAQWVHPLMRGSPLGDPMMGESDAVRLSSVEIYRALTRGLDADDSWIYLRSPASDLLPPTVRDLLSSFSDSESPLVIVRKGHATSIRMIGGRTPENGVISGLLSSPTTTPEITLSLWNVKTALEGFLGDDSSAHPIVEGMLATAANDGLGGDWSLRYDLLPLLDGEGTVRITTRTASGGVLWLVESDIQDRSETQRSLASFHDAFRSRLLGSTVTERLLDHGITSRVLKIDPSAVEDVTSNAGPWTMRVTRERSGGRILVSAQSAGQFLIGNAAAWAEQLMQGNTLTGARLPQLRSPLVAGGTLARTRFSQVSSGSPSPLWAMLTASLGSAKEVLWSLEADGNVLTLSIAP